MGYPPPTGGRIDDVDVVPPDPVEHHEVVEVPVQDRPLGKKSQLFEVGSYASGPQSVPTGRFDEAQGVEPVAAGTGDMAHLGQRDLFAVEGEDHGQRRRPALGQLHRLDVRDPPSQ